MGASLCSTITCASGGDFGENGVWPSLYDVVVSWFRLQTPKDCIPHPYWMYTKCLSTLRCCGWEFGYALMPYYMCRWGWILGKMGNGVWLSLYDVAVSWVRLQTPIDCIPHPYWMYTKCFSTLRCCRWAYGYTFIPYYMCRWGWISGKSGMAEPVWCCGVMVEAENPHLLHPTSILDVYKEF